MGILNLSPVAPLEATIRSDSRQKDVGLAVGFQNLYIDPELVSGSETLTPIASLRKLGMGAG